MIDKATVDRIYSAADIVEVVGDFVSLRKKGVNYQACCPFHNEKTPSFVVSPTKGLFKCFGCGKGGNAVTFVMEHEGMGYVEALKFVAKKYGIEVEERELSEEETKRNDDRESMLTLNSWSAEWFRDALHTTDEGRSVGLGYLRSRGFSDEMIERFGLGYCPGSPGRPESGGGSGGGYGDGRGNGYGDGSGSFARPPRDVFTQAALKAGYKEEFLTGTGLTIIRENGGYYDRFSERVMFPIHSMSGRVLAFGGRTLRTDKNVAKYQNSPESEIYSKKQTLYGIFFAKKAISQQRNAILVEGYTDVISMHQAGVENVVASSGTSLTTEQVKLLKRFTDNVTVIYDGDDAGIKASLRGIDMILREGLAVRVVLLPDGDDPDSFARKHNAAELQNFIREREEDFLSFKARLLMREARSDVIKRAAVVGEMVESIAEIPDDISRSMYIKECARTMDVDEGLLSSEVAKRRLLAASKDSDSREFIRRQEAVRRAETAAQSAGGVGGLGTASTPGAAGSSIEELEKELVKYLIKYGHEGFDFQDGRTSVTLNVADTIAGELQTNGLEFRNPQYRAIYDTYLGVRGDLDGEAAKDGASEKDASENGGAARDGGGHTEVPAHHFITHHDAAVCNVSVDLLTADDIYTLSKLWKRHDVIVTSERERLPEALPRAVILYRSKVIELLSAELRAKLKDPDLPEADADDILRRITALNRERTSIARRLSRLIL
ncbi:MAG: DNA primase [Alistipes sp.]|nr:DNA primase [Alistipes sp.]